MRSLVQVQSAKSYRLPYARGSDGLRKRVGLLLCLHLLAAAALLHARTGQAKYDDWYKKLWAYAWEHFVDHRYGGWYRILTRDNRKYSDEKSPAGKTDYHTMGACYEVLALIRAGAMP